MVEKVGNKYQLEDNVDTKQEKHGCLEVVFEDGRLVRRTSLKEIRAITNEGI